MAEQIRVMVVDDHPMWRDGVARDLGARGFDVVSTADGVDSAERIARAVRPDVVLMDMQLGTGSGVDATAKVLACSPESKVLVLSASGEQSDVLDAVKAGASGYLVKSASVGELVDAVIATAAGQAVFTPGLAGLVLPAPQTPQECPVPEQPSVPLTTSTPPTSSSSPQRNPPPRQRARQPAQSRTPTVLTSVAPPR